ncbi:GNAT family N-acetyltransferase [Mesotoga sp. Brook.08.YT.4.2.5.4.]|uniref:GNAT family N-acetyltransferase n=1 Tax=unclassified Mesotoga TaxID=1184398 RepID=UPI000C17FDF4
MSTEGNHPGFKKWGTPGLIITFDQSSEWKYELANLLGDKIDEMPRRYYISVKLRERNRPPTGFEIMTVKTALEERSLKGQTGWFNAFWPDTCSFLRSGIGYCVVKNNQIVAWCITIYSGERRKLGLETQGIFGGSVSALLRQRSA